jgi:membrane protein DedA with SNARE-associated domain
VDTVWRIVSDATLLVMTFGYSGIIAATVIEGSGIPLPFPGALLLAFVGYTAWRGQLDIIPATLAAACGLTAGAWLLYRLARDAAPRLQGYGRRLALSPDNLSRADSWFKTHAGRATFLARMTPGVRIFISFAAGLAHMNQALFILATFAGTWLWSALLIGAGWTLGEGWHSIADLLTALQTSVLLVAAVVVVSAAVIVRGSSRRKLRQ